MANNLKKLCEAFGYRSFDQGDLVVLQYEESHEQSDFERDRGITPRRHKIEKCGIVTKIEPYHVPEGSNYVVMAYYGDRNEQVGAGNWDEGFRKANIIERLFLSNKFPDKSTLEKSL